MSGVQSRGPTQNCSVGDLQPYQEVMEQETWNWDSCRIAHTVRGESDTIFFFSSLLCE